MHFLMQINCISSSKRQACVHMSTLIGNCLFCPVYHFIILQESPIFGGSIVQLIAYDRISQTEDEWIHVLSVLPKSIYFWFES